MENESKENNNSSQEEYYKTLNTTLTRALSVIKILIYPLSIIFIIILIFWGIDIFKLNSELDNIKSNLEIRIKEIDIKQRENDLKAEESLLALQKKLKNIDSSFAVLENQYLAILHKSNEQLTALKKNTKNLSELSTVIKQSTNESLNEYQKVREQYAQEIQYAKIGAEQRKKDIEEIFQKSKEMLMDLTYMIESSNQYINARVKGMISDGTYDHQKVKTIREDLNSRIEEFRKLLQSK